MKRAVIAVMLFCGAAVGAQADTWIFKDTLRPHGHERGMAAKRADAKLCGSNGRTFRDTAQFPQCMAAHGWSLDHVKPDPADTIARDPDHTTVVHFDDQRKKPNGEWRGNGVLQADTRRCGAQGRRDYQSQVFQQCMASLGWRHSYTHQAAPTVTISIGSSSNSSPDPSIYEVPPPPPQPVMPQPVYDINGQQM